jgi:hypothetical protein
MGVRGLPIKAPEFTPVNLVGLFLERDREEIFEVRGFSQPQNRLSPEQCSQPECKTMRRIRPDTTPFQPHLREEHPNKVILANTTVHENGLFAGVLLPWDEITAVLSGLLFAANSVISKQMPLVPVEH